MSEATTRHRRGYSRIRFGRCDFIVLDAPTDTNAINYVKTLQRLKCTTLVRTCEPSYSTVPFVNVGIRVIEMKFPDGNGPSDAVVERWLTLVRGTLCPDSNPPKSRPDSNMPKSHLDSTASQSRHASRAQSTSRSPFVSANQTNAVQAAQPPPTLDGLTCAKSVATSIQTTCASTSAGGSLNCGPIAVHCVAGLGRAPLLVAIALIEEGMDEPMEALREVRRRRPGSLNHRQITYLERYKPRGLLRPHVAACGVSCVIL
jgi:hypothetical protein